jgi:DNA-binding transcriptional LysR family regulator
VKRLADLNLLVAFDALMTARSGPAAARHLHLSQPAMSRILAKLRESFEDPLFVRVGNQMNPTPRALVLEAPIRNALLAVEQALGTDQPFDPAQSRRRFVLATADYAQVTSLANGIELMEVEAPGASLTVVPQRPDSIELLRSGEIDLLIGPELQIGWLNSEHLFDEGWRCLVSSNRYSQRSRWPLKKFARARHLLVSPEADGEGLVDRALADLGWQRNVVVRLPDFAGALWVVAKSDLLLTVPTSLANAAMAMFPLLSFKPPVALPTSRICMLWHDRLTEDPGHRWFRELIGGSARATVNIVGEKGK